jgi:S-adenosylmethionine:tRNA ribosyltransferase-isomerase
VTSPKIIPIHEYTYDLPEERIARYPLACRDQSKLIVLNDGKIQEEIFKNIDRFIPDKSQLYFNNTRVIHARLKFQKATGAQIEIFCLAPYKPVEYELVFPQTKWCIWECMVGNLKKWKSGQLLLSHEIDGVLISLVAEKIGLINENVLVQFSWNGNLSFGRLLDETGSIPIPPYLNREPENIDKERYQTIYSKFNGSVAAPTAGLHFTPAVFEKLSKKNISVHEITLHVGAGTFQPVKSENALNHTMHHELFTISKETLKELSDNRYPIIATGTTTLRTLESIYWLAVKSIRENMLVTKLDQWEQNSLHGNITTGIAFAALLDLMTKEKITILTAQTGIMIVPGYDFKVVNGLITNFHQPNSTLLLLVAAFVGDKWKDVYQYAMKNNFRFLSYGDSSLLWK